MNNIKRILIIALCSMLCVCTVPRFSLRSEAASTATYALYQTLLNLSGYLTTRGYSIVHEHGSSIPSITELQTMTYDNMGSLLFDISTKLNAFGATHDSPYLGEDFINALSEASFRGSILLSKSTRDLVDLWLETSVTDGSVSVGSITQSVQDFFNDPLTSYQFRLSNGNVGSVIIDPQSICFSYRMLYYDDYSYLIFLPASIDDFILDIGSGHYKVSGSFPGAIQDVAYVSYENKIYDVYAYQTPYFSFVNFPTYPYGATSSPAINFSTIATALFNAFYSGNLEDVESGSIVTTQITDTSETDLLTSTNTVASDGTIEGDTTIYLPDQTTLENAIDQYNQGGITYEDFLKIFGINSVASDATVQEKEDALTVVVTPSEDYLWFTKTQWGADSLEQTRKASASTRAEEDSLADSIANTANGGSDPEDPENKSRGKGLLALLLLGLGIWNTPIIAGDGTPSGGGTDDDSGDGSGDTSGYLAESIAGMAVAGSLVDDLFDSAGGSNGYGLIYTVGASFVIFSVIIGAANYFGALFHGSDTKQNIKASGKRSTPGKEKKGG